MFDAGPLPTNLPSSTTEIRCNACGYTVSLLSTHFLTAHAMPWTLQPLRALFTDRTATGRSDSRRVLASFLKYP